MSSRAVRFTAQATLLTSGLLFLSARTAHATEYHVAPSGEDSADGSPNAPWKTIQKAADTLMPGDIVTIHSGTYREQINPKRGGSSEDARIVYRAAAGERVDIKGSEVVDSWEADSGAWKAVIPNSTFGSFNPFTTNIGGDYLTYGEEYHLGEVYLEGRALKEVLRKAEVATTRNSWYVESTASATTLWANFGDLDPSQGLVEVNTRKYVIFPEQTGLAFITIEGLYLSQAATQWAPPTNANPQEGALTTNWGLSWLIQNNHVSDAKTVGIAIGLGSGRGGNGAIDRVGNHVIRKNTVERCGQAGIAGNRGAVASVIEHNLVQEINPFNLFGGWEQAGIKIHTAIDVVIRGNVIRNVHGGEGSAEGIWIDWEAQGARVTGNVIYDVDQSTIKLEANHGPNLIDNNVLAGKLSEYGENTVFVHNLLVGTEFDFFDGDERAPQYYEPHTTQRKGSASLTPLGTKFFNNLFADGDADIPEEPEYASDYNVIYGGEKSSWADEHSLVRNNFDAMVKFTSNPDGVTVSWRADDGVRSVEAPLITRDFVGVETRTGQGLEYPDGSPLSVDRDFTDATRDATHPTVGPLEDSRAENTLTLSVGAEGTTEVGSPAGGGTSQGGGPSSSAGRGNDNSGAPSGSAGARAQGGSAGRGNPGSSGPLGNGGNGAGGANGSSSAGQSHAGRDAAAPTNGTSGASASGGESDADSGCGCRQAGNTASTHSALALGALLAALGARRRRPRSSAASSGLLR